MKLKIVTVIGARPQIIKAAALSRAIQTRFPQEIEEVIVHTGQHYDNNMSAVFFEELGIPKPDHNLGVGSDSHGRQTARMIEGIEEILLEEQPNALVLYGDTNSTLAGGVAASKLHIPVVHIEAGLRSFNKSMPEEVNRIMCDHVSTLLFSPTKAGTDNLAKEGFDPGNQPPFTSDSPGVYHCGDVMYDNSLHFKTLAAEKTDILDRHELTPGQFVMATVHRPSNTDDPKNLAGIFRAMLHVAEQLPVILPLHPRTAEKMKALPLELLDQIETASNLRICEPASFLEMVALESNTSLVMTDSGGVQKEAYFFQKPCVILREQTEWVELVENGTAILTGPDEIKIIEAYRALSNATLNYPPLFGDGKAAEFMCSEMLKHLS